MKPRRLDELFAPLADDDSITITVRRLREIVAAAAEGDDRPKTTALDNYLSASQVAELLGVRVQWCYENRNALGGLKLEGHVRFSERAVKRYLNAAAADDQ